MNQKLMINIDLKDLFEITGQYPPTPSQDWKFDVLTPKGTLVLDKSLLDYLFIPIDENELRLKQLISEVSPEFEETEISNNEIQPIRKKPGRKKQKEKS